MPCNFQNFCSKMNCKVCYKRSFACDIRAKCWLKDKNNGIEAWEVLCKTTKKFWFNCDNCKHDVRCQIKNFSGKKFCKYCKKIGAKVCGKIECKPCYERSFANHPKSLCWIKEKNDGLETYQVAKKCNKKFWFNCDSCHHELHQRLDKVAAEGKDKNGKNNARWCKFCTNQSRCKNKDCNTCYYKTFKVSIRAECWDYTKNDGIKPEDISRTTHKKYWFKCKHDHSFDISPNAIETQGQWCSQCTIEAERRLADFLVKEGFIIKREARFEWCKNQKTGKYRRYDFLIEEHKVIIETDGIQHFRSFGKMRRSPEDEFKNDIYKMKCANRNGYKIIRILSSMITCDTYNWWKTQMLESINSDNKKVNEFIANTDIYDKYVNYSK
jgi:very-short-patch-repair endonuclease